MSLTLNMVGGGGGGLSATDALLRVQAPAGSTVTIVKGSTAKTDQGHENADDNTVYDYYFIIHQSQFDGTTPWTVTATLGTQSASATVIINASDEYGVELAYELVLFENGTWAAVTGDVTSTQCTIVDGDLRSVGGYSSVGKWCTNNQIDVSKYTTLCMLSKVVSGSSSRTMWFGTSDTNNIPSSDGSWGSSLFTAYYSHTFSSAESDYTLKSTDISGASDLSYIKFGYYQETLTKRIWLE